MRAVDANVAGPFLLAAGRRPRTGEVRPRPQLADRPDAALCRPLPRRVRRDRRPGRDDRRGDSRPAGAPRRLDARREDPADHRRRRRRGGRLGDPVPLQPDHDHAGPAARGVRPRHDPSRRLAAPRHHARVRAHPAARPGVAAAARPALDLRAAVFPERPPARVADRGSGDLRGDRTDRRGAGSIAGVRDDPAHGRARGSVPDPRPDGGLPGRVARRAGPLPLRGILPALSDRALRPRKNRGPQRGLRGKAAPVPGRINRPGSPRRDISRPLGSVARGPAVPLPGTAARSRLARAVAFDAADGRRIFQRVAGVVAGRPAPGLAARGRQRFPGSLDHGRRRVEPEASRQERLLDDHIGGDALLEPRRRPPVLHETGLPPGRGGRERRLGLGFRSRARDPRHPRAARPGRPPVARRPDARARDRRTRPDEPGAPRSRRAAPRANRGPAAPADRSRARPVRRASLEPRRPEHRGERLGTRGREGNPRSRPHGPPARAGRARGRPRRGPRLEPRRAQAFLLLGHRRHLQHLLLGPGRERNLAGDERSRRRVLPRALPGRAPPGFRRLQRQRLRHPRAGIGPPGRGGEVSCGGAERGRWRSAATGPRSPDWRQRFQRNPTGGGVARRGGLQRRSGANPMEVRSDRTPQP